jgi:hypothetical protein
MKTVLLIATAAAMALGSVAPAQARQGCGPGFHRGPYGGCQPNGGPALVVAPTIGVFYAGRGYWDGHRYWAHREHWHGGWRYR